MDRILTKTSHHYRILISALAALVFLGVIFATSQHAFAASEVQVSSEHIITLHDDGVDKGFITSKSTLREALAEQKIRLDALDRTEPGLDDKLVANSYQVNVYRARPVVVRDGSAEVKIITAYRSTKQIAAAAHIELHDEDEAKLTPSVDPIADGAAEIMTITRATGFTFNFYGKKQVAYSMATTVGDMLREKGIKMQEVDGISPAITTTLTPGLTVKLWRNGVQTVTEEEAVAYETKTVENADQPVGYKKTTTEGKKGRRTVTYEINMRNGVEISRKEINSVTTKRPVQKEVVVGTKNSYSGSLNDWLLKLRMCETHGNYKTNTGNGYYGAYQFSAATWNSLNTGYARADLAPSAVQDAAIIANTNRSAGLKTQNPGCYRSTGISNKPPAS